MPFDPFDGFGEAIPARLRDCRVLYERMQDGEGASIFETLVSWLWRISCLSTHAKSG